jgi:hypothetical protein
METTLILRASPRFDLRRLDELTSEQRAPFAELEQNDGFYGLLVPRPPFEANVKSIAADGAALFRSLASPGAVSIDDEVIDLVLDGVLEVAHDDGFHWGAGALQHVGVTLSPLAHVSAVERLSLDALRYAADLETGDSSILTTALYLYNRIPISRFWRSRFADRQEILSQLGADRGALAVLLDSHWASGNSQGWLTWRPRAPRTRDRNAAMFKLYVSARPESIRDAFEAVVRVLAERGGADFKIGDSAYGLLRPDKLVMYFGSRQEVDEVAQTLAKRLAGCPAHGVPFTAGIDDDGLLSWGVDPPESERALSWMGRESWRLWLATKLGSALALAKLSAPNGDREMVCGFALERVRRYGVDVERWTPTESLWSAQ